MNKNNTNIFYWIKKHPKLTGILATVVYIVIPTLPFIQSPIGIFSKEDATLFLNYYGTIVSGLTGGALTLGGVWWTIKKQEEQRKNDLAIQYKPIIDITRNTSNDNDFNENYVHEELNELYLPITITNLGRGEALNIIIKNCFSKNILFTIRKNFLYKEKNFHDFIIIPIKYLQQTLYTKADGKVSECYKLNHFITIEYSDAFNNKYSDIFQINFEISKEFDIILQDSIEKVD